MLPFFLTFISLCCCLILLCFSFLSFSICCLLLLFPKSPPHLLPFLFCFLTFYFYYIYYIFCCPPSSPFVLPPAPCVLYLGCRAGVGLLLRDLGGKWLWSQPASTGGEPLQCASEDSQVDPDQHRPLWLSRLSVSPVFFHFPACFCFFSWLSHSWRLTLGLLKLYCHWQPGWYKKILHALLKIFLVDVQIWRQSSVLWHCLSSKLKIEKGFS